jgi:hypothetical protein
MRTTVLIAIVTLSLTAVLAAPQRNGVSVHEIRTSHLKHLALTKNLDEVTKPELLRLLTVALWEVNTAITKAITSVETLLAGTEVLDDVLAVVATATSMASGFILETIRKVLQSSVEEIVSLLEILGLNLLVLFGYTDVVIRSLIDEKYVELIPGYDDLMTQLFNDVEAAMRPVIDALYPPDTFKLPLYATLRLIHQ